jgi:hypothetical protein
MLKQLSLLALLVISTFVTQAQVVTSGGGGKDIYSPVKEKVESLLATVRKNWDKQSKANKIKSMQDFQIALSTLDLEELSPFESNHGHCKSQSTAALRAIFSDKELRELGVLLKSPDFRAYLMSDEKLKVQEAQSLIGYFREKLKDLDAHEELRAPKKIKPE